MGKSLDFAEVEVNRGPNRGVALVRLELREVAGSKRPLQAVGEHERGAEAGFVTEAGERLPEVRVGVIDLGRDSTGASLHPLSGVGKGARGTDQADVDVPRCILAAAVNGSVRGDAEARVDVPLALGEFQKRLAENRCCHFRLRLFVVDFVEPDR